MPTGPTLQGAMPQQQRKQRYPWWDFSTFLAVKRALAHRAQKLQNFRNFFNTPKIVKTPRVLATFSHF